MKVQVIINGRIAFEESASAFGVDKMIDLLSDSFRLPLLRECGVEAYIVIVGVQSQMNSTAFEPVPEWYDAKYFKEVFI